jgi:short-subunit dehydrogenase
LPDAAPARESRALVTGASSGIGAAFARALSARGERLLLAARREDRLRALAAELGGAGRVDVLPVDLAAPGGPARLFDAVASLGVDVHLVVNNAGAGHAGRFHEQPLDRVLGMVDLNARAATEVARRFVEPMVRRGRGAIVNVVSLSAFQPVPNLGVYAATKAYLLALTEAMHEELRGTGVRVQALCPGNIPTEFQQLAGTRGMRFDRTPAMSAGDVARVSLDALAARRHRVIVIPGLANRATVALQRLAPRAAVRKIAGRLFEPEP